MLHIRFLFFSAQLLLVTALSLAVHASASAATITWDGGGADTAWSTCANWSTDTCPGTADLALFNGTSSKNADITSSVSVGGISLSAGYTGTVTQGASATLTIGTQNFTQAAGTFQGSAATLDINGSFIISGGTFTAPSGTMNVERSFTQTGSPTWNANGGTVAFDGSYAGNTSVDAPVITFEQVSINRTIVSGSTYTFTIAAGTTVPLGDDPLTQLKNNVNSPNYILRNNGTLTVGSGQWELQVDGGLINSGIISGNITTLTGGGGITVESAGQFTFSFLTSLTRTHLLNGVGFLDISGTFTAPQMMNISLSAGLVQRSGASMTTAVSPTFHVGGGFEVDANSVFPTSPTLYLDGSYPQNALIDAPHVDFFQAFLNRTVTGNQSLTLTVAAGTTLPLGASPTSSLANAANGSTFSLRNEGVIQMDTGTWTLNIEGEIVNAGTITGSVDTIVGNSNIRNEAQITLPYLSQLSLDRGWENTASSSFIADDSLALSIGGSLVVDSNSQFPASPTLHLVGSYAENTSVDAPGVSFVSATFSRTPVRNSLLSLTIEAGTTLPLGNNPTTMFHNAANGYTYSVVNRGTLTIGTGTFSNSIDGTFTNEGTILTQSTEQTNSLAGMFVSAAGSSIVFLGDGDGESDVFDITTFATNYYSLEIDSLDGVLDTFRLATTPTVNSTAVIEAGGFCLNGYDFFAASNFTLKSGVLLLTVGTESYTTPLVEQGAIVLRDGCDWAGGGSSGGGGGIQSVIIDASETSNFVIFFFAVCALVVYRMRRIEI